MGTTARMSARPTSTGWSRAGVELDRHYVQPMCTPTRAALLTGRYPSRFGPHATVPSNHPVMSDGYETLASTLRNCGLRDRAVREMAPRFVSAVLP